MPVTSRIYSISGKGQALTLMMSAVSLQEGMAVAFGTSSISYSAGYVDLSTTITALLIAEAVAKTRAADVAVVNIGLSGDLAGEDRSLANIAIPADQVELLERIEENRKTCDSGGFSRLPDDPYGNNRSSRRYSLHLYLRF